MKIFDFPCYELKTKNGKFYASSANEIAVFGGDGEKLNSFEIPHPSFLCFCEADSKELIAVSNTAGRVFSAHEDSGEITEIEVSEPYEGTEIVFAGDRLIWADWNGRLMQYDFASGAISVDREMENSDVMPNHIIYSDKQNACFIAATDRSNSECVLLRAAGDDFKPKKMQLPFSERSLIPVCFDEREEKLFFCAENGKIKQCAITKDGKIEEEREIELKSKHSSFNEMISVNSLLVLRNSDVLKAIEPQTGETVFEFNGSCLSSLYFADGVLCVGSWKAGYVFDFAEITGNK